MSHEPSAGFPSFYLVNAEHVTQGQHVLIYIFFLAPFTFLRQVVHSPTLVTFFSMCFALTFLILLQISVPVTLFSTVFARFVLVELALLFVSGKSVQISGLGLAFLLSILAGLFSDNQPFHLIKIEVRLLHTENFLLDIIII